MSFSLALLSVPLQSRENGMHNCWFIKHMYQCVLQLLLSSKGSSLYNLLWHQVKNSFTLFPFPLYSLVWTHTFAHFHSVKVLYKIEQSPQTWTWLRFTRSAGPESQIFWFSRSGIEPECLHSNDSTVDSDAADTRTTLKNIDEVRELNCSSESLCSCPRSTFEI